MKSGSSDDELILMFLNRKRKRQRRWAHPVLTRTQQQGQFRGFIPELKLHYGSFYIFQDLSLSCCELSWGHICECREITSESQLTQRTFSCMSEIWLKCSGLTGQICFFACELKKTELDSKKIILSCKIKSYTSLSPPLYPWDLMNILFCLYLPHNLHTPQALFAKFGSLQQTQIKAETQIYYLLVKEFTGFLLDGVEILDLPGWETHDESYALCCGRVLVEVVTRGLRPLVDPLVYGLTEVHSLQTTARRQSFSDIQRTKTTNITLLCPFLCFCPPFFFFDNPIITRWGVSMAAAVELDLNVFHIRVCHLSEGAKFLCRAAVFTDNHKPQREPVKHGRAAKIYSLER